MRMIILAFGNFSAEGGQKESNLIYQVQLKNGVIKVME